MLIILPVQKSKQLDFFKSSKSAHLRKRKNITRTSPAERSAPVERRANEIDTAYGPGQICYGGDPAERPSRRKMMRPLDTKRAVRLVMKSSYARGAMSFTAATNFTKVAHIIDQRAKEFGVKVHRREIMSNHIHVVASFKNRVAFQNFLRTVTALIARTITGARKGRPFQPTTDLSPLKTREWVTNKTRRSASQPSTEREALEGTERALRAVSKSSSAAVKRVRFFNHVVFSRVISGLKDFRGVFRYLRKNEIERKFGTYARRVIENFELAARDAVHKQIKVWSLLLEGS